MGNVPLSDLVTLLSNTHQDQSSCAAIISPGRFGHIRSSVWDHENISLCLYVLLSPSTSPVSTPTPQKSVSRVRFREREVEESMLASQD